MELNIVNDLFLGRQELNLFKDSIKAEGYEKVFKQAIKKYGVVRLPSDPTFESLKAVIGTSATKLTIKSGIAIDNNIDIIDVASDLIDHITIPGDNVIRYVIAKYDTTKYEQGTVAITADGQLTGTGTLFTEVLRGLPNFPSKVEFNSGNNTGEFEITSVTNDTTAQLNVSAGSMFAEAGVQFSVIGTFTPGIAPPAPSKNPFVRDFYEFDLNVSPTVVDGLEFVLASVVSDGITTTIVDMRDDYTFSNESSRVISTTTPLGGIEKILYGSTYDSKTKNQVHVGWGFKSLSSQWSYNSATNQITLDGGSGGIWASPAAFANGQFDGWQVFFKSTGQQVTVTTSTKSGSDIVLTLEHIETVDVNSDLTVVPMADFIELDLENTSFPIMKNSKVYPIHLAEGEILADVGYVNKLKIRYILGMESTPWININDGNYTNEDSFDEDGNLTGALLGAVTGGDGTFTPLISDDNHEDKKAWRGRYTISNLSVSVIGGPNGNQITIPLGARRRNVFTLGANMNTVRYMTTLEEGQMIALDLQNGGSSVIRFETSGTPAAVAGLSPFFIPEDSAGLGYAEFDTNISTTAYFVCTRIVGFADPVWKLIGTSLNGNLATRFDAFKDNAEGAWTFIDLTGSVDVVTNDQVTGLGLDVALFQAPQAGSFLAYKIIGKTVYGYYAIVDSKPQDHTVTNAASYLIKNLPFSAKRNWAGTFHMRSNFNAVVAGINECFMDSGSSNLGFRANAIGSSNTAFNRTYDFIAATDIQVAASVTVFNPEITIAGSFIMEIN